MVVVLPVPLTPTTRITAGLVAEVDRVVARAGQLGQQLGEPRGERLAADQVALLGLLLELGDDLRGRAGADVGVDQRLLEPLPGLLVEVALEQRGLDLGAQRLARLAHVLAHAAEEAAPALLALGLGLGRRERRPAGQEEVVPVARHGAGRIGHDAARARRHRLALQRTAAIGPRRLLVRLRRGARRRAGGRGDAAPAAAARDGRSTSRRDGGAAALHDGDELVATPGRWSSRSTARRPPGSTPRPPPRSASRGTRAIRSRRCFGCGPERDPADALCLYSGRSATAASRCRGRRRRGPGDGVVDPLFAWAALDCPSSAPFTATITRALVLGRLTVALEGRSRSARRT